MREAFVESVVWRDSGSFGIGANWYIDKQVLAYQDTSDKFWNALITLATTPNHPLNADYLHEHLNRFELAERDAWWSIFLHNHWGERGTIDRLIEWAWDENNKSEFNDEVIRLAGTTLAWFFTTANRFLRDCATKAMVRLCECRVDVLRQIMTKFVNVKRSLHKRTTLCGCLRLRNANKPTQRRWDVWRRIYSIGFSNQGNLRHTFCYAITQGV